MRTLRGEKLELRLAVLLTLSSALACSVVLGLEEPRDRVEVGGGAGSGGSSGGTTTAPRGGSGGGAGPNGSGGSTGVGGNAGSGATSSRGGTSNAGGTSGEDAGTSWGGSATDGGSGGASGMPSGGARGGSFSSGGTTSSNGGSGAAGGASSGGKSAGGTSAGGKSAGGTSAGGASSGGKTSLGGTTGAGGTGGGTFQPCPSTGACKILPLGDSITVGIGLAGGYRVQLFAAAVQDGKNITFTGSQLNGPQTVSGQPFPRNHEGHSGFTISQTSELVPSPALSGDPNIVLLHVGSNDIATDAVGAPGRVGSLIDEITLALPNTLVAVAQIIPISAQADTVATFNAALLSVVTTRINANKHVILVDQRGLPATEQSDGFHPTEAGYTRMAGVWYAAIKPYLR